MSEIINRLSELAAKQRLVPFLGAGCSARIVPPWNPLMSELAARLGIEYNESSDNAIVAQQFVDRYGKGEFCKFLCSRLSIEQFPDELAYIHVAVMNMGVPTIYTTNQDNVMEKGYEKLGRTHRVITKLKDFAEIKLSEQLYIKFHGDLNEPETIVFTKDDFEKRKKDHNHPLNIRLRADLLEKNILFIGYGFRDINIREMFAELRETFYGELPTAYMIAYQYRPELQEICDEYGIVLIDPMKQFPESKGHDDAFEKTILTLLKFSRVKKVDKEIKELFLSAPPHLQRTVSGLEIKMLQDILPKMNLAEGVELFRQVFDGAFILPVFEDKTVEFFIQLCKSATNEEESNALSYAIFNLGIKEKLNYFHILSALMATANVRTPHGPYGENTFIFTLKGVDNRILTVLAAKAIQYVYSWGTKPTSTLVWNVGHWIGRGGATYDQLPCHLQSFVQRFLDQMMEECWTVMEHPVSRQRRLGIEISLTHEETSILEQLITSDE